MDYTAFGIGISVSSMLSASAAFLLGFYFTNMKEGQRKKAHPLGYLVVILSALILFINSVLIFSINLTNHDYDTTIIFVSTVCSFFPPIAFIGLLIFKH